VATELQLGTRIRSLRQARHLTLRDVAERAGVTESFLSQVERDVTSPSIATVHRIARALDLSIAQLFAEEGETGRVVRREARRRVAYKGLKAVDEFLTSNMSGRLQVIMSTIEPGGGTGADPYTHDSDEEVVVVLEGVLDLWVGDEHYVLREGDAITYPSRVPHWNVNHGTGHARVLFCITPPSF
jgi:transcriptional regulator with XRE-family HTH domain